MAGGSSRAFTEGDVRSLGRKLRELKAHLTPGERNALQAVVLWAIAPVQNDVQGYMQHDDEFLWRIIPADPDWGEIIGAPGEEQL